MKKIILAFFTLILICIFESSVQAVSYNEYIKKGNWIDNIFIAKEKSDSIQYEHGRFLNRASDNHFVYCVEVGVLIDTNFNYPGYISNYGNYLGISSAKAERVLLLAYYGYGFGNHLDEKWYAITQVLIWQTVAPNHDIYFTDTFEGKKTNRYDNEINEINQLVNNHSKLPSFSEKTFEIGYKETIVLDDSNSVLNNYSYLNNPNLDIVKQNNKLVITAKENINTKIEFYKKSFSYQNPPIIFHDASRQDILMPGYYEEIKTFFNIKVIIGSIDIIKLDYDTKQLSPRGDASLEGAVYGLYNLDDELLEEIVIDGGNKGLFNNLPMGKYYIQEIKPGNGYGLNLEKHEIEITVENPHIELILTNKVIESKLKLYKQFELNKTKETFPEENILFEIYNLKNDLVSALVTSKCGYAEVILPFGKYLVKQITSREGFLKVEDFWIEVIDDNEIIINLINKEKILFELPNTFEFLKKEDYSSNNNMDNHSKGMDMGMVDTDMVYKSLLQQQLPIRKVLQSQIRMDENRIHQRIFYAFSLPLSTLLYVIFLKRKWA